MIGEIFNEKGESSPTFTFRDNFRREDWVCPEMFQFIELANKAKGRKLEIEHFQEPLFLSPEFIQYCIIRVLIYLNLLDARKYQQEKLLPKTQAHKVLRWRLGNHDIPFADFEYGAPLDLLYPDLIKIFPSAYFPVKYRALVAPYKVPQDVKEILGYIGELGGFVHDFDPKLQQVAKDVWAEIQSYLNLNGNVCRIEVELNELYAQHTQMETQYQRKLIVRNAEAGTLERAIKKLELMQKELDECRELKKVRKQRLVEQDEIKMNGKDVNLKNWDNGTQKIQWTENDENYRQEKSICHGIQDRKENLKIIKKFESLEDLIYVLSVKFSNMTVFMDNLEEQECRSRLLMIKGVLEEKQALERELLAELSVKIPNSEEMEVID